MNTKNYQDKTQFSAIIQINGISELPSLIKRREISGKQIYVINVRKNMVFKVNSRV